MPPFMITCSGSTASKETLAIVPPISPTSPYLSKSDLDSIHNDIKAMTGKHHSDIKYFNDHISDMLANLTDTISKTDKQEVKLTYISSKISTYEDCLEKLIRTETQSQPLSLQIT